MGVGSDRGSGSTLTAALVLVLLSAGIVCLGLVQAFLAANRTQAAADLAALAAAGSGGCSRAASIAHGNGARMIACSVDDGDAVVTVEAPAPALVMRVAQVVGGGADSIRAIARAGYASS